VYKAAAAKGWSHQSGEVLDKLMHSFLSFKTSLDCHWIQNSSSSSSSSSNL